MPNHDSDPATTRLLPAGLFACRVRRLEARKLQFFRHCAGRPRQPRGSSASQETIREAEKLKSAPLALLEPIRSGVRDGTFFS